MRGMEAATSRRVLGVLFAIAVANAVLLLALLGEPTGWAGPRDGVYVTAVVGFALLFGVLTIVRDRAPRVVLVLAVLAVCAYYTVGLPSIGVVLPLLVFLAAATTAGHRWFALAAAVSLFVVAAFFRIREGASVESILGYELFANLALAVLAIALAEVIAARRELQRSQALAAGLAADAARTETERTQLAERARIARELHDDLGHSLAIISLHTNASAERLPDGHPAAETLEHARLASGHALRQLRAAVSTLNGRPSASVDEPGLADVPAIADRLRAGGITVRFRCDPASLCEPPPLRDAASRSNPASLHESAPQREPASRSDSDAGDVRAVLDTPVDVASTAFRIVQEATTNAVRHARPRAIDISLDAVTSVDGTAPGLRIEVRNDGTPTHEDDGGSRGSGRGLAGLRARVDELGGRIGWGSAESGEFVVEAFVPFASVVGAFTPDAPVVEANTPVAQDDGHPSRGHGLPDGPTRSAEGRRP